MTRQEAIDNITAMRADTPRAAMMRLIEMALTLTRHRLTDEAAEVYAAELARMKITQ